MSKRNYDPPLDKGIAPYVEILNTLGIETYESCEGGNGHSYPEPTIAFHGDRSEGFRALAIAHQHALPVSKISRVWDIIDGEPVGPHWEITFYEKANDYKPDDYWASLMGSYEEEAVTPMLTADTFEKLKTAVDGGMVIRSNGIKIQENRGEYEIYHGMVKHKMNLPFFESLALSISLGASPHPSNWDMAKDIFSFV